MLKIEVFKTNIVCENDAERLNSLIAKKFPDYQVNFDLNDCDHVMRVVSPLTKIDIVSLIQLGVHCDLLILPLPDEVPA